MSRSVLNGTQVGTNCGEIATVFPRVLHSILPHFFDNRVSHLSTSSSSSGEQISGHKYPSFWTISRTTMRVNGLFRRAKFHVHSFAHSGIVPDSSAAGARCVKRAETEPGKTSRHSTVDRLERAIDALAGLGGKAPGRRGGARHMSAAARKRIADAQRARWAMVRAEKTWKLPKPPALGSQSEASKRQMSAAGRKRIATPQRATWARVRAEKAEKVADSPDFPDFRAFVAAEWVMPLGAGQANPEAVAPLFAQAVFLQRRERHADALAPS